MSTTETLKETDTAAIDQNAASAQEVDTGDQLTADQVEASEDADWAELEALRNSDDDLDNDNDDDDLPPSDDDEDEPETVADAPETTTKTDDAVDNAHRSDVGRVKGIDRRLASLTKERDLIRSRMEKRRETQTARAERRPKLDEAREEYADIIDPILDEVDALAEDEQARAEADTSREAAITQEIEDTMLEQSNVFIEKHPKGYELLKEHGEAFWPWVDDQPKRIRDIAYANKAGMIDGAGAAEVSLAFEAAIAAATGDGSEVDGGEVPKPQTGKSSRRKAQLASAKTPRARSPSVSTDIPANSTDEDAIWASLEKQREKRMRQTG